MKFFLLYFILINFTFKGDELPNWAVNIIQQDSFCNQYLHHKVLANNIIYGDFNGDNKIDIAILIINKNNNKFGIAILHNAIYDYHIIGAGNDFGDGGDNLKWLQEWGVYKNETFKSMFLTSEGKGLIETEITLKGDGIFLYSGLYNIDALIYWNGLNYEWGTKI